MFRRWAQRRYDRAQAEYWQSIEPVLGPEERKIASAPARNLWDGPQDGVLFLTDRTIYWGAWLGQGRQTRPMFAQDLRECPSTRIGEQGTLDVAVSGEYVGSFASFAPAPGGQWSFAEFCKSLGQTMENSRALPRAGETPSGDSASR
ncbi:hypothetical protein QFZ56_004240 [Streptomyces achromogenes]|uniref:Uncharacterized protein n=1 Tax=Streptomyces achromogenes TaxID=67255 RepID=A0ABU0Q3M8_STRAH|nr:hypothetical protein [Streptomyces achromogenes]